MRCQQQIPEIEWVRDFGDSIAALSNVLSSLCVCALLLLSVWYDRGGSIWWCYCNNTIICVDINCNRLDDQYRHTHTQKTEEKY